MRTTSRLSVLSVAMALVASAACAHHVERREERREPVVEAHGDWVKLGERWVDGAHDRDVIHVGAREGLYRRIRIVVERSPLEMYDLLITFGDGTPFSPQTRHIFGADTHSHVIELPGGPRVIRTVEFRYGKLPGEGRALAELWAE
jgi:hypothetical protein